MPCGGYTRGAKSKPSAPAASCRVSRLASLLRRAQQLIGRTRYCNSTNGLRREHLSPYHMVVKL